MMRWVPVVPYPPLTHVEYPVPSRAIGRGESHAVHANPILGGLHHEYFLAPTCV
jgi:hypothetical protein